MLRSSFSQPARRGMGMTRRRRPMRKRPLEHITMTRYILLAFRAPPTARMIRRPKYASPIAWTNTSSPQKVSCGDSQQPRKARQSME
jgi:hypothetical protein